MKSSSQRVWIPIEKLSEWIDAALQRASVPNSVADYFLKQLRASA